MSGQQPLPPERRREARVIGGVLLGLVGATVLFWGVGSVFGGSTGSVGLFAVVILTTVAAVVALAVPHWRRAGAGLVTGLAIGAIVFAGSCAAIVAWLMTSLA